MSQPPSSKKSNTTYWAVALIFIFTGVAAPIGILMLILKAFAGERLARGYESFEDLHGSQEPAKRGRKTTAQSKLEEVEGRGNILTILGSVVALLFSLFALSGVGDAFYWLIDGEIRWFLQEIVDLVPLLCFVGAGLGCLWAGLIKKKQARRWREYLSMVGARETVSISALATASGRPDSKVQDDLKEMLDHGLFPHGYLDYGGGRLILRGGVKEEPKKPEPAQEDAVLAEIRAINDAIKDKKMSAQIDRIEAITAKILEHQKTHPEKEAQLHSFLSYYLPTTLKILRAYAQLEAQQVSGANITASMERIEGMMGKVVEGFEAQLDKLFQGDAMDIASDVEVLERMLAKDGLSDGQGFTLNL